MSAKPDVRAIELSESDEFFVLASDGIFDVFDNDQARAAPTEDERRHADICAGAKRAAALFRSTRDRSWM